MLRRSFLVTGFNSRRLEKKSVRRAGTPNRRRRRPEKETPNLQEFTRDLTAAALDRKLDPLIGREEETERLVEILCRRTKNNPVLIGESGVGKTAIIEGLAQLIADKNVPSFLANKRILSLDLSLIVAGTKVSGTV